MYWTDLSYLKHKKIHCHVLQVSQENHTIAIQHRESISSQSADSDFRYCCKELPLSLMVPTSPYIASFVGEVAMIYRAFCCNISPLAGALSSRRYPATSPKLPAISIRGSPYSTASLTVWPQWSYLIVRLKGILASTAKILYIKCEISVRYLVACYILHLLVPLPCRNW